VVPILAESATKSTSDYSAKSKLVSILAEAATDPAPSIQQKASCRAIPSFRVNGLKRHPEYPDSEHRMNINEHLPI
jgi:hypothetical protein